MFDHLEFSVTGIAAARRIYRPLCEAIGAEEIFYDEDERQAGYGRDDIVRLLLTEGRRTVPSLHVCFVSPDRPGVAAGYRAALAGGAADNGAPGYRDHYAQGYFAAFVHDPDGHNVEVLFRDPARS